MKSEKVWSGERLETHIFNENTIEHLHRYAIAVNLTRNKVVLDIACGEGYGTNLIAKTASQVYGVDISKETIDNAKLKYKKTNLKFKVGSTSAIPLGSQSVDMVVSFETIEHHNEHEQMMLEIKRVLRPNGLLLISSPDKRTYTDLPNIVNPHHIKELYLHQFKILIQKHFLQTSFHFQKMMYGSFLYSEKEPRGYEEYFGNYDEIEIVEDKKAVYIIGLASNDVLPNITTSLFQSDKIDTANFELGISSIKSSWSYRIGNFIIKPFSLIKSKINA